MGQTADLSTRAPAAGVRMHCPSALEEGRGVAESLRVKGRTPVRVERMRPFLSRYPDRKAAQLLEAGFAFGFKIPCSLTAAPPMVTNLRSALLHPTVVSEKIEKEVSLGRMSGPFTSVPLQGLVVSPLGVLPKKEPNKFRLIHHLSFPKGGSVNDSIAPEECAVTYTSFDAAISWVRRYGQGSLMAKADSFRLLGCAWNGAYYVDRCLPMGCSISCALFEAFSSFLEWVVRDVSGINSMVHYLDDFLCVGPPGSNICAVLLGTLQHIAERFGVPLAPEKTEGPKSSIVFLGIEVDSLGMECRLPVDKLESLKAEVREITDRRKVQLRQLQSLLGKLNFAC